MLEPDLQSFAKETKDKGSYGRSQPNQDLDLDDFQNELDNEQEIEYDEEEDEDGIKFKNDTI